MKHILLLVAFAFISTVNAQNTNQEIALEGETPFLLGKIDKSENTMGVRLNRYELSIKKHFRVRISKFRKIT